MDADRSLHHGNHKKRHLLWHGTGSVLHATASRACLLFFMLFIIAGLLHAAPTPVGTVIINRASALYEVDGQQYRVESNQVQTVVKPLYGISILPDGTFEEPRDMFASPGTTVVVPYTLANTGNSNDHYSLSLEYDTASTLPFGFMAMYLDRNGNGLLDAGEPQVQNTEQIGPEQSISLLVAIEVRSFAVTGQYLRFSLKGVSFHDTSKSDENNWVRLTVTGDSVLAVTKSVSAALARPGDPLIYAILVRNTGNRPAYPLTIDDTDTDGDITNMENPSGLLIKDTIPEGIHVTGDPSLDFPVPLPPGCIALYGYENGKWSVSGNVTAWGGVAAIRQVGMLAGEPMAPGQALQFSWRGLIDNVLSSSRIRNNAVVLWSSGNESASATTNVVFTEVRQLPSVRIGPKDNPDGALSGSYRTPDPVQGPYTITYDGDISVAGFVSGAEEHATKVVYFNTLQNKGSSPDSFNLRARWIDGQDQNARKLRTPNTIPAARTLQQASIRYFRADGVTPLLDTDGDGIPDTGLLQPGAVETVRVEVLIPFGPPADDLAHDLEITASSSIDPLISDTTINRILFSQSMWMPLLKTASPEAEVQPGSKIAYVINFGNNGPLDAANATLFDILPHQLQSPVLITDGEARGTLNGQPATIPVSAAFSPLDPAGTCGTITWIFPLIPRGFQGYVSFSATVKADAPDGTVIENKASLTAAGMTTAHSNTTSTMVMRPHRLLLEKNVDTAASAKGSVISYTLVLRNASDTTVISSPVKMTDRLPGGFHYVPGSSVLNGLPFSDPSIQADGLLVWDDLGSLSPLGSHVLVYKVQIGPSARPGDNVNRAQASGILATGRLETSNTASANIVLYENLATNSQSILGRVFYDLNHNGIVDEGEPGLPGVRIYLENGTYTITDSQGKYHFENVSAGTHVIKLDTGSLPKGVRLLPLRQTLALGDADSILVMLQQNELYKANFAVQAVQPAAEEKDLARTGADLAKEPEPALETLYAALRYSREPSENNLDEHLVRVRIDKAAAGPLSNAYLVILPSLTTGATLDPQGSASLSNPLASTEDLTSLIDPLSIYVDHALPEAVFPFDQLLWIRLPAQQSVIDSHAYDSKGGQEKVPANAQGQTIEVHYLAWKNLTLQHFLVGLNAAGTVTVISDTRTEASSVLARERRSQLADGYRKIQPEAADAPLQDSDLQPRIVRPGIQAPREGDTFWFRDKITVQTASPVNAATILTVNGQQISQAQIGRQSLDCAGTIQRLDFIGVPLREGKNRIEFTWKAPDGTEGHDSLQVFFAGCIEKVLLETRPLVLFADGKTEPELHIKPLDKEGIPMADGAFITLELDHGRFVSADANPHMEGFQARIRDGKAVVSISAEQSPGTRHITVRAGNHVASLELVFLPFLRDWLVTGYGSATLRYTINQRNVFGDVVGDPDGFSVDARAAFFAKGTLFGCYLLTAALDTGAIPDRDLLFSETDREKSYPIYGDSSIQRYDAPSADARFFRVEKDTSYFQYGDFTTGMTGTELARYGRSFTGARLHLDECLYDIDAFWTVTDQSMIRDEMRGDGTSGYYQLSHTPIVLNSDAISIEIRSASNPSEILQSILLRRNVDYWINYLEGTILFREPVRSVDDQFNPVYIVAVYEVREEDERHGILGIRPRLKLFDEALIIGGTGILEHTGISQNKLYGADLTLSLGRHFMANAEIAASDVYDRLALTQRQGAAATASFKIDFGKAFSARVRAYAADREFRNPSLPSQAGAMREISALAESTPVEGITFKLQALRRENLLNGDAGNLVFADATIRLSARTRALTGLTYADIAATSYTQQALLGKAGARIDLTDDFTVTGFVERTMWGARLPSQGFSSITGMFDRFTSTSANADPLGEGYLSSGTLTSIAGVPDRAFLGGEYRLAAGTRLVAGYEWLGGDDFSTGRVLAGIQSQLSRHTYAYANYGMEDSLDLGRNLANFGIKTKLELGKSLSADAGVEALAILAGTGAESYVAPSLALSWLGTASKHAARYEVRWSPSQTRHLVELATARKVDRSLSWTFKDTLQYTAHSTNGTEYQHNIEAGAAFRPLASDTVNMLVSAGWLDRKAYNDDRSSILKGRIELHWQPVKEVNLSGLYAFRWQSERAGVLQTSNYLDLYAIRAMADVSSNLNAGIHAGIMPYRYSNSFDYYVGVEAGHRVAGNLYLSGGWNMRGLNNKDLVDHSYWSKGFFLTLRMKVDEGVLGLGN